jgi:hypothetical protein
MSSSSASEEKSETSLILKTISNMNNGQDLQMNADCFIDRVIYSYSITKSVPKHREELFTDESELNMNDFIYGLRLLHPIQPYSRDISSHPQNNCGTECFIRTIGTIRSRKPRDTPITARQLLITFIDTNRIEPMPIICSGATFITERIGSSTFEMFHPLPSEIYSDPRRLERANRIMETMNAQSGNVTLRDVQIHFLRKEGEMYTETDYPFKIMVNKEALFIASSHLLSGYDKTEITTNEAERIIFDVFRIFQRDSVVTTTELSRIVKFYRNFANSEYSLLSDRERLTFNLSLEIIEITSGMISRERSVFTR